MSGLPIGLGYELFLQKTKATIENMLIDMERLVDPLVSMGTCGIEAAKQQWKLEEYITKLKKIAEVIGE